MKSLVCFLVVLAALAVALEPLFFTIDRIMVFNTVPRDDYAPFLLWLAHAPGGAFPGSPYGYRILTIVAALPLYYLLPTLHLTNLPPALTPQYVQATAALAALSYLSLLASGLMMYRLARDRMDLPRRDAAIAGVLLSVLILYTQFFGVDAFAILLVTAGLYLLVRPAWFAVLIIPAAFANEKIAIVFALWLTLRCITSSADRRRLAAPWLAAMAAIAAYAAALLLLHLPGNAYQLEPGGYPATLLANLRASVSARGLLLNALPVGVLLAVGGLGWQHAGRRDLDGLFHPVDLLIVPALVLVALVLTQFFQTGRLVMHAAPLFVVPAAVAIGRWMEAPRDADQRNGRSLRR
ncbi:MAG TPA: hypothetical protein VME47_23650 [Acetobacteraceae bacterium]|nr:hypothetical protein [Acetobacteraceae bacterium]